MGEHTINSKRKLGAVFAALLVYVSQSVFAKGDASADSGAAVAQNQSSESIFTQTDESQMLITTPEGSTNVSGSGTGAGSVWVYVKMLAMLGIVIVIIYLLFKFLKRGMVPVHDDGPFLRKVASLSLSPGKSVQIVTLVDEAYMLGVCENSVNLISKITDKEMIQALNLYADKHEHADRPRNFTEVLELFMPNASKASHKNAFSGESVFDDSAASRILDSIKNKSRRLEDEE